LPVSSFDTVAGFQCRPVGVRCPAEFSTRAVAAWVTPQPYTSQLA
jgi:hypothetical protein